MGVIRRFGGRRGRALRVSGWLLMLTAAVLWAGCQRLKPVDTHALDMAGMGYDSVSQVKALKITQTEVAQVAEARQAGLSDAACVQVMQIYRSRKQSFDAGDSVAGLLGAGASEDLVLKLARINQLGLGAGELEAMRLAGLSDDILLAVAQHHSAGQPVLSGASLASMKNLGMGSTTLLQLAERGVPDSQAAQIMALRRRGVRDSEILREFAGS
jgi:hypothetical protein